MMSLHQGQCGLCMHFGEHQPAEQPKLQPIRQSKEAPEDMLEECGHPRHEPLHLLVTPISGCEGFEPAAAM